MTKERAVREQEISGPKTLRTGGWKPVEVEDESDDMELDDSIKTIDRGTPLPQELLRKDKGKELIRKVIGETSQTKGSSVKKAPGKDDQPKEEKPKKQRLDRRIATLIKESDDNPLLKKALKAPFETNLLESIIHGGEVRALLFKPQTLEALDKLFMTNIFSKAAAKRAAERDRYSVRDTEVLMNVNYLATCPQAIVELNGGRKVRALIDSGAEVNIVSEEVAMELGLAITEEHRMHVVDVNENVSKTRGLCENVRVSIGRVSTTQCFLVMANPSKPLILGMPFT